MSHLHRQLAAQAALAAQQEAAVATVVEGVASVAVAKRIRSKKHGKAKAKKTAAAR